MATAQPQARRTLRVTVALLAACCAVGVARAGPMSPSDCLAHPAAVVLHGDARFTVLSERVVRMERAAKSDRAFVDDCTFTVVRRAMPSVPQFTRSVSEGVLQIETAQLRLIYNGEHSYWDLGVTPCGARLGIRKGGKGAVRLPRYPGS